MLFHHGKDPVLEPVDKLDGDHAGVQEPGVTSFLVTVLLAVWLTCRLPRHHCPGHCHPASHPLADPLSSVQLSGRFCGNVYALHDEPLPWLILCHLDADYWVFLQKPSSTRMAGYGLLPRVSYVPSTRTLPGAECAGSGTSHRTPNRIGCGVSGSREPTVLLPSPGNHSGNSARSWSRPSNESDNNVILNTVRRAMTKI